MNDTEQRKKKILVVNFFPAFTPPKSGGELRYFSIYKALAEHYDITLINPTFPEAKHEIVQHHPNLIEYRVPKSRAYIYLHRLLDRLGKFPECSGIVVGLACRFHKALRRCITEQIKDADLIMHDSPFLVSVVKASAGQREVYNSYNVEFDLHQAGLRGPLGWLLCQYVKRLEKRLCQRAELIFATSDADRQRFFELYEVLPTKVALAPNGVDTRNVRIPTPTERQQAKATLQITGRPALLFFGSVHPPNVEAVRYILDTLAPEIPHCVFLIAGGVCKFFSSPPSQNVRILGTVTEEKKHNLLKAADIAINPMFSGSGTNVKMLDYLASGIPVVSTPIGARGLSLESNRTAILCEAREFPHAINSLLKNEPLREQLRRNGRQLVEQSFDWQHIARRMHATLEQPRLPVITVVNTYPVLPLQFGGQFRIYNLYSHLAAHFRICYLCFDHTKPYAHCQTIRENFYQITIPEERLHRLSERICLKLFKKSLDDVLAIFFSKWNFQFKKMLRRCADTSEILIACHCYLFRHLRGYHKHLRIHETQNVEADLKQDLFKKRCGRFITRCVRRVEALACRKSSAIFCVSKGDVHRMQELYQTSTPCYVFPNGVDTSFFQPIPIDKKQTYKQEIGLQPYSVVFFIGSAHGPNIDATRFIVRKLAPALPELLFFIAGSVCWGVKDPPPPPNVKLFYEVDRVIARELLHLADFAINPMSYGSGTNIKMADFLATGLPTVTTPIGARGLDIVNGKHAIICERSDFITQLRRLRTDQPLADTLGRNARQLATTQYDWELIAERMVETLTAMHRQAQMPGNAPSSTDYHNARSRT